MVINHKLLNNSCKNSLHIGICLILLFVLVLSCYEGLVYVRHHMQRHFTDIHTMLSEDATIAFDDRDEAFLAIPADTLQWKLLAQAHMVASSDGNTLKIEYNDALHALNHRQHQAKGFIFPLEQSSKQTHFLLSPYPPSCPFCLPAGPSELIEIRAKTPIPFTYDAIRIKGNFELLTAEEDVKEGMIYRMTEAVIVE